MTDTPVNTLPQTVSSTNSFYDNIKDESVKNYNNFIHGIPTAFIIIPLVIFILSPDAEKGIFLFGSITTILIIITTTLITNKSGKITIPKDYNIQALCIGYLVGYFIVDHINYNRPGSLLSALVFGIILIVSITSTIPMTYLFGNCMGMLFGYLSYKNKLQKKKK
tara:strand:+ start:3809 stop:4303 length:495 start_codon:yes stop_codon:yes gene_type:complete